VLRRINAHATLDTVVQTAMLPCLVMVSLIIPPTFVEGMVFVLLKTTALAMQIGGGQIAI
jgi:hypothetical protein